VKQLGLERRVVFAGQRSDVYGVLGELSVMAHCSIEPEPFGRVLIEAMALRVPVVATGGGAVDEIIRHGENGLIVPPRDQAALAAAVSAVLDGTVHAGALAERALEAVRDRFSPAVMMASIQRILGAQP
jgi:glycosyltransferase involved in cell wall biosynthesis